MAKIGIKYDLFSERIKEIVDELGESVNDAADKAAKVGAEMMVREAEQSSPIKTGRFKRGWYYRGSKYVGGTRGNIKYQREKGYKYVVTNITDTKLNRNNTFVPLLNVLKRKRSDEERVLTEISREATPKVQAAMMEVFESML